MSNHRRHENVLPLANFATWLLLAAAACAAGLYFCYCKQQLISRGAQIHALEKELTELRTLNEGADTEIAKLSSPTVLRQRRLQIGAKYVAITADRVEMLPNKRGGANELRVVSNTKP